MKFCSVYFGFVIKQEYAKTNQNAALALMFGRLKAWAVLFKPAVAFMKKILMLFLTFVLFSSLGIAQDKNKHESAYLKVRTGDETITYEFDSVLDFDENSEKILNEINASNPTHKKDKDTNLTIEISITTISDNVSSTVTGSVTAFYSSIISAVKKLRTQLIAIVIG